MFTPLLGVILCAACLHACWNALIRAAYDKRKMTHGVVVASGAIACLLLPLLPHPLPQSWFYIVLSACFQVVYYRILSLLYQQGDFGQVYPLMRGFAPLLATMGGYYFLDEQISAKSLLGIFLICAGLAGLSLHRKGISRLSKKTFCLVALNACVIALYTLTDGQGVRLAHAALSYTLGVYLLTALFYSLFFRKEYKDFFQNMPVSYQWHIFKYGLIGALFGIVSYAAVLWVMMYVPIGMVAALRETSSLFAIMIGIFFFKEKKSFFRIAMACVIVSGIFWLQNN